MWKSVPFLSYSTRLSYSARPHPIRFSAPRKFPYPSLGSYVTILSDVWTKNTFIISFFRGTLAAFFSKKKIASKNTFLIFFSSSQALQGYLSFNVYKNIWENCLRKKNANKIEIIIRLIDGRTKEYRINILWICMCVYEIILW